MAWEDALGYLAAAAVFSSFYMRTMIPLRIAALVSNVAFLLYGAVQGLVPILILHAALLPLNTLRLYQGVRLIREVRRASTGGGLSLDWLVSEMDRARRPKDGVLFRKGEHADRIFVPTEGTAEVVEHGVRLGPGAVLGEIGVFSGLDERTATVRVSADARLLQITGHRVRELALQHPEFAYRLMLLITRRMVENAERQRTQIAGS